MGYFTRDSQREEYRKRKAQEEAERNNHTLNSNDILIKVPSDLLNSVMGKISHIPLTSKKLGASTVSYFEKATGKELAYIIHDKGEYWVNQDLLYTPDVPVPVPQELSLYNVPISYKLASYESNVLHL